MLVSLCTIHVKIYTPNWLVGIWHAHLLVSANDYNLDCWFLLIHSINSIILSVHHIMESRHNKWILDVMLILETWLHAITYYIEINTLNISLNLVQDKDPLILATLCLVLDVLALSWIFYNQPQIRQGPLTIVSLCLVLAWICTCVMILSLINIFLDMDLPM